MERIIRSLVLKGLEILPTLNKWNHSISNFQSVSGFCPHLMKGIIQSLAN